MGLERVYKLKCGDCGHLQLDNIRWVGCLRRGCNGKYSVVEEFFAGR